MSRAHLRDDDRAAERLELVRAIEAEAHSLSPWRRPPTPRISRRVLDAIGRVPRHEFVGPEQAAFAYADRALPIGRGQTISQPFVVALTTELASVGPDSVALDVGTGSGYQAAVLAELAARVYTIELDALLAREAAARLARLGYRNVESRVGDGHAGWPEHAPYDAIVVAAATPEIPPALVEQLAPGGRLVVPVGPRYGPQLLTLVEKGAAGDTRSHGVLHVAFVPLRTAEEKEDF